jgi:hypothetical protein
VIALLAVAVGDAVCDERDSANGDDANGDGVCSAENDDENWKVGVDDADGTVDVALTLVPSVVAGGWNAQSGGIVELGDCM